MFVSEENNMYHQTNETFDVSHHKHLESPYFEQIRDGKKISECRLKRSLNIYRKGDIIRFYNHDLGEIHTRIIGTSHYHNFEDMLSNELQNVLPEINSIEEGLNIYRSIYKNREEEERLGIVVIHIELITDNVQI